MVQTGEIAQRQAYHHGDLRQALLTEGLALAREGGPDAVVLREATRRAGVSPNAAYRHFSDRDALLAAVSDAAQGRMAAAIDEHVACIPAGDAESEARGLLRAVGTGYVAFAQDEPGLFRVAMLVPRDLERAFDDQKSSPAGRTPFEHITVALDALVASGAMPASRRPRAEFLAWSSVHGLSGLLLDGPLRALPRAAADVVTQQLCDMVEAGFTAPSTDATPPTLNE